MRKLPQNRDTRTDYFAFLRYINKGIRADAMRGFEARTDEMRKEKERETQEKATNDYKRQEKKGEGRWKRKWAPEGWAGWNAKRDKTAPGARHDDDKAEPAKGEKITKESK